MKAILGRKIGMTSIFDENGKNIPCTVVEAGPCTITQVRTEEVDGYSAVQMGFEEKKDKHTTKALKGHFEKAGVSPKKTLVEVRDFDFEKQAGDEITLDIFEEGETVHVVGTSKGRGFQGVVKRHGFSGVGMATHGQHNRLRAPGSIGMASTPSKVLKGMKMAGRMGTDRVKTKNLKVVKIIAEENIMLVSGCVPGHNNSLLLIESKK